jgi:HEAT repeat protein
MQEFQLKIHRSPPVHDDNGQAARSWRIAVFISALLVMAISLQGTAQTPAEQQNTEVLFEEESFDAEAQQAKLAAIHGANVSAEILEGYLRDTDPVIESAAYYVLGARSKRSAVEALIDVINDQAEPVRLQALQLLLSSDIDRADEAAVLAVLIAALQDPDPGFIACATQALVTGNDPAGESALRQALRSANVETRLLIVQSLGIGERAEQYLYLALSDPDETVRNAAEEILAQSKAN